MSGDKLRALEEGPKLGEPAAPQPDAEPPRFIKEVSLRWQGGKIVGLSIIGYLPGISVDVGLIANRFSFIILSDILSECFWLIGSRHEL